VANRAGRCAGAPRARPGAGALWATALMCKTSAADEAVCPARLPSGPRAGALPAWGLHGGAAGSGGLAVQWRCGRWARGPWWWPPWPILLLRHTAQPRLRA
jgi:hypothetical protein